MFRVGVVVGKLIVVDVFAFVIYESIGVRGEDGEASKIGHLAFGVRMGKAIAKAVVSNIGDSGDIIELPISASSVVGCSVASP